MSRGTAAAHHLRSNVFFAWDDFYCNLTRENAMPGSPQAARHCSESFCRKGGCCTKQGAAASLFMKILHKRQKKSFVGIADVSNLCYTIGCITMKARNKILLHYDAILFDVDGTLIDSAPGIIHTLQEVFLHHGCGCIRHQPAPVSGPAAAQKLR